MSKKDLFNIIQPGDIIKKKDSGELYQVKVIYDGSYGYGATLIKDGTHYDVYSKVISSDYELVVEHDPVNNPQHYTNGNIECVDAMIAAYGKEVVMHFCQCNAFKYQWRFDKKNGVEDLKKAEWYNNKYIELKNGN